MFVGFKLYARRCRAHPLFQRTGVCKPPRRRATNGNQGSDQAGTIICHDALQLAGVMQRLYIVYLEVTGQADASQGEADPSHARVNHPNVAQASSMPQNIRPERPSWVQQRRGAYLRCRDYVQLPEPRRHGQIPSTASALTIQCTSTAYTTTAASSSALLRGGRRLGIQVLRCKELWPFMWHFEAATLNLVRGRKIPWKRRRRAEHFYRRPKIQAILNDSSLDE